MKTCPHCKSEINEQATNCPECGGGTSKTVAVFSALAGALLLGVLGFVWTPLFYAAILAVVFAIAIAAGFTDY